MKGGNCTSEKLIHSVEFKSGAVYIDGFSGAAAIKWRCSDDGHGTFSWPSTGLRYTGPFLHNKRQGRGTQVWDDGSCFEGEFKNDMRHGIGKHVWPNGEVSSSYSECIHRSCNKYCRQHAIEVCTAHVYIYRDFILLAGLLQNCMHANFCI